MAPGPSVAFGAMTREEVRRRLAAERSRLYRYREQKPYIFAVGADGCDHLLDREGACVRCDRQIVVVSRPVPQSG